MASEIRVDKINSLSGVGTVTLSPTGVDIAGITTAATLRATTGIVTSLTAGSLTSLGAVSGTTGTFSGAVSGTTGTFSAAVSGTTGTFTGDVDIADKIIHTGDTNTAIRFPAADTVTVETGGTERLRITSDGDVGINRTSPAANLDIASTSEVAIAVDGWSAIGGGGSSNLKIGGLTGSQYTRLDFYTGGSERLRIDSNGKIGVGGAPSGWQAATTTKALQIGNACLFNYNDTYFHLGQNFYFDGSNYKFINNGYATRLLQNAGEFGFLVSDASGSADGNINFQQKLRVTTGGDVDVEDGDIFFSTAGKGIVLGATSNTDANTLDDYEEGSWTPTARNQGSFTSAIGRYVKIGQQVTVWGYIPTVTNNTSNDILQCSGLPFTVTSSGNTEMVGTLMIRFVASTSLSGVSFNVYTNSGRDYIEFYACRDDDNNYEAIKHSDLAYTNSNGIRFCLTYVV